MELRSLDRQDDEQFVVTESYKEVTSWGRFPKSESQVVFQNWACDELAPHLRMTGPMLPYGLGRSYGDSCLNSHGTIINCQGMNRILAFDSENGLIKAEAGLGLDELLKQCVPRGWFLPVTPGTKFVTLAGAVANDIHGKNHHQVGTFGNFVSRFELLRSDGSRVVCSPEEDAELYAATIGGLGLTGMITWVELQLKRIRSSMIEMESIKVQNLDEFLEVTTQSDADFEYTVSWLDCCASGDSIGKGIFMRGNHSDDASLGLRPHSDPKLGVPLDFPNFALNQLSIKAFNFAYYHKQLGNLKASTVAYDPFFYPLDAVNDWNRIYGRRGFFQYQFVVPFTDGHEAVREILHIVTRSGEGSFLAVLKTFGAIESRGMLSFPRPGVTIAMDFPNRGKSTLQMMDELDKVVMAASGRLYPAKDARMPGWVFRESYPNWESFAKFIDPRFSSDFWRRITES